MDLELVKTFLAVYETGTFNSAAERLNVTQSTVSMRIANLESQLGTPLFTRSRAGTGTTASGQRFHRHAAGLMRIWRQANQDVAMPDNLRGVLSVAGQVALWDELLINWVAWMRTETPDIALRAILSMPSDINRMLQDGELDLAVMYVPQARAGQVIDRLFDDRLVLVGSHAEAQGPGDSDYVFVDWGPEFRAEHAAAFPGASFPALSVSHATLAMAHILAQGGSGYFPERLVRAHIKKGRLHRVKRAPWFSRPAFAVYPEASLADATFTAALNGLHAIARRRAPEPMGAERP